MSMRYRLLRFPGGKAKAVTLSYDDGCPEDIRFVDTISKAGLKCTFNYNSDAMRDVVLSKEQVEEHVLAKGHEIAVHGSFHRASGHIRPIEGIREVLDCRLELEERYGIIVRGMAYPDTGISAFASGNTYEDVKKYLEELDIAYCRAAFRDNFSFTLPADWHAWMPSVHHANPKVMEYIDAFLALNLSRGVYPPHRAPRLFFLWGHTYEFERGHNWELLDEICDKLAGKEDIWYATNMEVYNYVTAYNSLVYSADGKIIYNPTLLDIWFDIDGKLYQIAPGETLKI